MSTQEATGLLAGLRKALSLGKRTIVAFMDSKLVRNLIYNVYTPKNEQLRKLVVQIQKTLNNFEAWVVTYVTREWNEGADWVTNSAMDRLDHAGTRTTIQGGVEVSVEEVMQWVEST